MPLFMFFAAGIYRHQAVINEVNSIEVNSFILNLLSFLTVANLAPSNTEQYKMHFFNNT